MPTTNISKTIWEAIKAKPNMNSQQIADAVAGGNTDGIATRLKQMIDRGVLTRDKLDAKFRYQAVGDSYPAFNREQALAKAHVARAEYRIKRAKQREYNAKYKEKLKAEAPAIPPTSLSSNPNAEQLVNSMSVGMAKAVYLELKKVFEQ